MSRVGYHLFHVPGTLCTKRHEHETLKAFLKQRKSNLSAQTVDDQGNNEQLTRDVQATYHKICQKGQQRWCTVPRFLSGIFRWYVLSSCSTRASEAKLMSFPVFSTSHSFQYGVLREVEYDFFIAWTSGIKS